MIDLHMHTIYSDGTDDLDSLIKKLEKNNIKIFSITDHDNFLSFINMKDKNLYLKQKGIRYISGMEISTDLEGESTHLLVYGYEEKLDTIQSIINELHELRLNRIRAHLSNLKLEFDIEFNKHQLDWLFSQPNPSKPHIANMLIDSGYGSNITDVIKKYLSKKYSHFKLDAKKVVKKLSECGLIVGLAHPLGGVGEKRISIDKFEHNVQLLKQCGLKFVECYYSLYNEHERTEIKNVAKKYSLSLSGGSDYHGKNKTVEIGGLGHNYDLNISDFTILNLIN